MEKAIQFLNDYWPLITAVLGLAEIILRMIPTTKNWSIIDKIYKALYLIVPNKRKPPIDAEGNYEDDFVRNVQGKTVNKIEVPIFRHIIKAVSIIVLASFCHSAPAQIWQNFKGVRLVNVVGDTSDVLQVNGSIFYCEDCTPPRFYVYEDNQWKEITGGSGGGGNLSGTLTSPRVPYASDANTLVDDAGFEYDVVNNTLEVPYINLNTGAIDVDSTHFRYGDTRFKITSDNIYMKSYGNAPGDSVFSAIGQNLDGATGIMTGYYNESFGVPSAYYFATDQELSMNANADPALLKGSSIFANALSAGMSYGYSGNTATISAIEGGINVNVTDVTSQGLYGNSDYSANYTDLSYIQKGYADDTYLSDITGLITAGTNVTITGSGTSGSPYVINSSGGGGGGISNTSPVNTLPKTTDGSGNLGASGIQSRSAGNLDLGLPSTTGTDRNILAMGNTSTILLSLSAKGASSNINMWAGQGTLFRDSTTNNIVTLSSFTNSLQFDSDNNATVFLGNNSGAGAVRTLTVRGQAGASNTDGGNLELLGGNGAGSGDGGAVLIEAGQISSSGTAGNVEIRSGEGTATGVAGSVLISTGAANGGTAGDIVISGGDGSYLPKVNLSNNLLELTVTNGGSDNASVVLDSSAGGAITMSADAGGVITIGNVFSTDFIVLKIPTSCTGAPSGALWNDSGTLKICP